jgi:hypothetical protein
MAITTRASTVTSRLRPRSAPAPLTLEERVERRLPAHLRHEGGRPADPLAIDGRSFGRLMVVAEERRKVEEEDAGEFGSFWDGLA